MFLRFQERTPPLIDDFLYICDGAYKQHELIRMEMDAFRTIGYDLGIPLSYRFLRRYARVSKRCIITCTFVDLNDGCSRLNSIYSFVFSAPK